MSRNTVEASVVVIADAEACELYRKIHGRRLTAAVLRERIQQLWVHEVDSMREEVRKANDPNADVWSER